MPIHDWTRVNAGIFHHFHHEWIALIARELNVLLHGTDFYALAEQVAGGIIPDVLTLQQPPSTRKTRKPDTNGGLALKSAPPQLRFHVKTPTTWYARTKKSVTIRHISDHRIVAVLEIVSSGNKASRVMIEAFRQKAQDLLQAGVHLAFVDLFPPTARDPEGLHPIIWDVDDDADAFMFDPKKPLTCASYHAGPLPQAFIEPLATGDELPSLPLYLTVDEYLELPLESTYQGAFSAVPEVWQDELRLA